MKHGKVLSIIGRSGADKSTLLKVLSRVTEDIQPAEILRANHAFRAVLLDAGDHTVSFDYRPASFRWGAWVTLGAGLLLATLLNVSMSARRDSPEGEVGAA